MTKEEAVAATVIAMYECGIPMTTRHRVIAKMLDQMDEFELGDSSKVQNRCTDCVRYRR